MSTSNDAISAILEQFKRRYSAGDVEGVVALFDGEDAVVVGTGADEVRFGLAQIREQVERDVSQADSIGIEFSDLRVSEAGDVAFAYAAASFKGEMGGESFALPVRATFGLVKRGGDWRVRQFHVSVAFGEQETGQSFPS